MLLCQVRFPAFMCKEKFPNEVHSDCRLQYVQHYITGLEVEVPCFTRGLEKP